MIVNQAYRFALDPTPRQERNFLSHAGAARVAFNWGLARVKAVMTQRDAERSYGVGDDQLTDEQHSGLRSASDQNQQPAEDYSALMDQCSRQYSAGTTPHQPFVSRPRAGARSDPRTQHRSRRRECSPACGYQAPSLPAADPAAPIRQRGARATSSACRGVVATTSGESNCSRT